ncbi:MAG: SpoIID/LytB domain-containing protein [Kineosporiaceae bacterium]
MRSTRGLLTASAVVAAVVVGATVPPWSPAPPPAPEAVEASRALTAPTAAPAGGITVSGRGWGHGRGMGQWGAFGYAVDRGWSSAQILDHYYGGTRTRDVGNVPIGVDLLGLRGRAVPVTGDALAVGGGPVGAAAVLVRRNGAGTLEIRTGPGCAGPWSAPTTRSAGAVVSAAGGVGVCESGLVRGYRGSLRFADAGGQLAVVNQLPVEDYLRGVVPREAPASWATAGGGRGAQALQAQAVAARSYALSTPFSGWATTCDTTQCQVYRGSWTRPVGGGARTSLEDPRTDAAIAATAGRVRARSNGSVARTEFSASTGGWSAGGDFPAVVDEGDTTSANPHRAWSVRFGVAELAQRLGTGPISDLAVTRRTGQGPDGGRVLELRVVSAGTVTTFSGSQVRSRLGLRSTWFTVSGFVRAETAQAAVQALYRDVLGRPPTSGEAAERVQQMQNSLSPQQVALDVARSPERAQSVVVGVYQGTLGRTPAEAEIQGWIASFQRDGSVPVLQASILASDEAWLRSGRDGGRWVDRMYRATLGRGAAAWERDYWSDRLAAQGRYGVALGIAGSLEAGQRRLSAYYASFLGRGPDPGSAVHVGRLLGAGDGDRSIPAAIVASPEYLQRAEHRF